MINFKNYENGLCKTVMTPKLKQESVVCFGIHLAHLILGHSDNLSRALQSAKLSANEAQEKARCTVMVRRSLRTEDNFKFFYETVTNFAKQHDAGQASLP